MTGLVWATLAPARVIVDPNSVSRRDAALSVVPQRNAERPVVRGDFVWAIQPDDDGYEGVAPARVDDIDNARDLLFLRVDWEKFAIRPSLPRNLVMLSTEQNRASATRHVAYIWDRETESEASRAGEVHELVG